MSEKSEKLPFSIRMAGALLAFSGIAWPVFFLVESPFVQKPTLELFVTFAFTILLMSVCIYLARRLINGIAQRLNTRCVLSFLVGYGILSEYKRMLETGNPERILLFTGLFLILSGFLIIIGKNTYISYQLKNQTVPIKLKNR